MGTLTWVTAIYQLAAGISDVTVVRQSPPSADYTLPLQSAGGWFLSQAAARYFCYLNGNIHDKIEAPAFHEYVGLLHL